MKSIRKIVCAALFLSAAGFIFTGCISLPTSHGKTTKKVSSPDVSGTSLKTPTSYANAYKYRTGKPNAAIQKYIKSHFVDSMRKKNPDKYVKNVTAKINKLASNDFERVKMAHDVICLLVTYDAKSFFANKIPDQSWQKVLRTKSSVCEGYSNVFQRFMTELRIPSQKVIGYASGVDTDSSSAGSLEANHAWNAVNIKGDWYLIDCTWDSGYIENKKAVRHYSTDWLFLKPQYFVYSHYPEESKYQLLEQPLSAAQFKAQPDFRPLLFEVVESGFESIKNVNSVKDSMELKYKTKTGYKMAFTLTKSNGKAVENRILSEKSNGIDYTTISFPEAGTYTVMVYCFKDGASKGEGCGQFQVKASAGSRTRFPKYYQVSIKNAAIITPKTSPIAAGKSVHFEVMAEGKEYVAVIIDGQFTQLKNAGKGKFTGDVKIPKNAKQVGIGLSSTKTGKYETLAVYDVE